MLSVLSPRMISGLGNFYVPVVLIVIFIFIKEIIKLLMIKLLNYRCFKILLKLIQKKIHYCLNLLFLLGLLRQLDIKKLSARQ